jgi:hypothetical protein
MGKIRKDGEYFWWFGKGMAQSHDNKGNELDLSVGSLTKTEKFNFPLLTLDTTSDMDENTPDPPNEARMAIRYFAKKGLKCNQVS